MPDVERLEARADVLKHVRVYRERYVEGVRRRLSASANHVGTDSLAADRDVDALVDILAVARYDEHLHG